ncbi:MAG: hypothetical protein ING77_00075 [Rhodocyclaceae bacterium]|jgi:hypothetical protein|uniref:hypothetical protein n=1 Tax=Phenylobacterium sp. TaxID=1871053 RepID=UPI0025E97FE3|nr:hypothetical protein [Phenylobacterium sp.]MCA3149563.1 hypothetical protein [Rhodocyclaceae bacterium]MCA3159442.1 hypothetical protein [Burkholderiales bacterium]MCA3593320.1 hypothetical protein [Methylocystis sp.]MCA3652416.1 hypothetical protein [Methylobacterium sp.]MCA6351701.1 hypothetical protein [Phenylobacterium sp.]
MFDLGALYSELCRAADGGDFETAVLASPLGDQLVTLHPLGFNVVKIETPPHALRLHLWKCSGVEQPGFEVHDHVFDLKSRVIDGAIRHRAYRSVADPSGEHVFYRVEYGDQLSELSKTQERFTLQLVDEQVYRAGTSYSVNAFDLHDAEMVEGISAVTLVLTTHVGGNPRTVGPWNGQQTLSAIRAVVGLKPLRDFGLAGALNL